jgi:hypothetical protein
VGHAGRRGGALPRGGEAGGACRAAGRHAGRRVGHAGWRGGGAACRAAGGACRAAGRRCGMPGGGKCRPGSLGDLFSARTVAELARWRATDATGPTHKTKTTAKTKLNPPTPRCQPILIYRPPAARRTFGLSATRRPAHVWIIGHPPPGARSDYRGGGGACAWSARGMGCGALEEGGKGGRCVCQYVEGVEGRNAM